MTKLSKNLTYAEAIASQTATRHGIKNIPTQNVLKRMVLVANNVFQPIRDHFNTPIRVSSFFRNKKVNQLVGGSLSSQHVSGEAIDLQGTNGLTNAEIFEYIKNNLDFDQLINEYPNSKGEPAWVHVSFREQKRGGNRKQILTIGKR
jgi:zinc D-Ala-D-Ala carboxypeptidase